MDQAEKKLQYGFENKFLTYQSKDKDGNYINLHVS